MAVSKERFLDHMHGLNAGSSELCRSDCLETKHGSDGPFDGTVILFYPVVQILGLVQADGLGQFAFDFPTGACVNAKLKSAPASV